MTDPILELWKHLERAIELAVVAHKDQEPRADGTPYITHPLRMAFCALRTHEDNAVRQAIVALLHDTVEDTAVTLADLRRDYPIWVAEAVDALSRRDDETYMDFVRRTAKHDLARQVKLLDVHDNMRNVDEFKPGLRRRYERALKILLGQS